MRCLDALRHADAPSWVVQALGGWEEGTKVSDNYGRMDCPDQLKKHVDTIDYQGLNLDKLMRGVPNLFIGEPGDLIGVTPSPKKKCIR